MNSKRLISAFLTLVMLIGTLAVGVDAAWADKVNEDGEPIINYLADAYTSPDAKLADMIMVKEQNGYQLWFEEFTGEIAVVDLATGQVYFSNPWDVASGYQTISDAVKEQLLSQLTITFLENDVQKTMHSYTEAALRGQIVKKNIKNGIRVEYVLGEEQTIRLVPRMIQMERFEELILANIEDEWQYNKLNSFYTPKDANDPNLTERGVAEMQAKFPITLEMAVYVCDPEIKARELRELESIIKSYCPEYTYEELDYDHDLTRYTGDDAAPPRFRMALEYTLSDTGLQVRLPANGLSFDESAYQFQEVAMLPWFGAGSNEFTGYSVIPDGSGALIRFEDFVGKPVNIAGQMYGADYAYHEISGAHAETMRMPYFGVVTNYDKELVKATETTPAEGIFYSNGFLAVVTEGDSLASLMAVCGGTLHPYNSVYAKFIPRPSDEYNLADSISVSGNATWTVTSKRKYTDSYRIQYIFLKDETLAEENGLKDYYEADWTGMATAYRDYLTDKGELSKLENTKEDIPLFIETFGSIETTERLLSFPIEVDTPLTTFEDIKTMHSELTELGIGNINFKLTGYANGGLEGTVPYRLEWTKVVGGADGFRDLAKYAADNGFNVYPDFDFAYIRNQEMFDGVSVKKHAVRTIDDRFTTRRAYDAATQSFDRSFAIAISPVFYEYLYNKFGPTYLDYGNDAIAVSTLGTDLNSDFDEDEPYHREDNKQFTIELLEKLDADYESVMVEGGNAYAIKYADVILNASLTSSKYVKASESVPFLGMVYHGSKVFTGSATNMEGDVNQAILQAIENGAAMYFILSYQNTSELKEDFSLSKYYSVSYDIWKEDVAEYYNTLNTAIKDLQTSYIVDHEFLDAERIPDADELEADRLAEEAEAAALAAAEEEARLDEERKARLEARLAAQAGEVVEEPAAAPVEEEADETEEEVVEEEEEYIVPDKYKTVIGSVVRVEYEGGVNFILNYNSYDIIVEYDGQEYEIAGLGFVRID